jgi:serine/threonine protein kinase
MISLDHQLLNLSDKILEKHKKLGAGGFGQVFSSLYKSLPIAIKEIPIYKELELKQIREIMLLRKLRHNLIPRLIGIKLNDKLSIITELIPGTTLDKLLRKNKLSTLEKIVIVLDIITALEYLHSNKVIHRDLKPSNVMIDLKGNQIKLIDFGISKESRKEITTTQFSGSLIYMAPENFEVHSDLGNSLTDKPKMRISTKVDIWALGCLISEIFSGEKPWGKLGKALL